MLDSLDEDGSPYQVLGPTVFTIDNRQFTDELQLLGKAFDRQLDYVVGGFYLDGNQRNQQIGNFFGLEPVAPVTTLDFRNSIKTKSIAGYAQGTLSLGEWTGLRGLAVTAGVRYTSEKTELDQLPGGVLTGIPGLPDHLSRRDNQWSWQFGVQEQLTPSLLLYATTRRSFRSGGFNGFAADVPGPAAVGGNSFDPEIAKDIELGAKFQQRLAGDVLLRSNLALYRQKVDNIQRSLVVFIAGNLTGLTANIPQAEIKGVEWDTDLRVGDWLQLGGNLAYTDAKFTKNSTTLFGQTFNFGPYSDAPKWIGSVYADVGAQLPGEAGRLSLRGNMYAQSRFYFSSLGNTLVPQTELPSYQVVDLHLTWDKVMKTGLSLSLHVKNVFDKVYYVGGTPTGASVRTNLATPGEPRTVFGEATFRF